MDVGISLLQQGRYEEALENFLWCFDHGEEEALEKLLWCFDHAEKVAEFPLRMFLFCYILLLGNSYPPAIEALRLLRDAAEKTLLSDYADFGLVIDSVFDLLNLNRIFLGEPERSLEIFDQLAEGGDKQKETRKIMLHFITQELVSEKRYETILEGADENLYETLDLNFDGNKDHIGDFGHYYESYLGTGRLSEASKLLDYLLGKLGDERESYVVLIKCANRVSQDEIAKAILKRGLETLPRHQQHLLMDDVDDLIMDDDDV